MCGIAGYYGPADRFDDRRMEAMLAAIEHRGPDDSGFSSFPADPSGKTRVWLGNRRLAIQDLSPAGHQPMSDAQTGSTIVFNGEIYNFLELRQELERAGHRFRSHCDTEVALRSWGVNGSAAVQHWRGMFGAAVWDQQLSELWLVRDHWGIKPLYYWSNGEMLLFCSEVRGLLASGLVPRQLSRRGLQDYLHFGAAQDPVTLINDVYNLLPGHAMRVSPDHREITRLSEPVNTFPTDISSLDPILRESVRQQLISDVPVGVFLSGGVDSSVVALLARQEAGSLVNTMSLVFDEQRYSERDYARAVANHIGTQHHEVVLRADDARIKALEAISRMDQPSVDGLNTYTICEAARQLGFHVALSGLGGDEFFGGYHTFRRTAWMAFAQRSAARAPWLARTAGATAARMMSRRNLAALKLARFFEYSDSRRRLHPSAHLVLSKANR